MRSDIHCPVLFSPFCVSFCVCDAYVFGVYVSPVYLQLCAGSCSDVEVSPVVGFAKCTQAAIFSGFTSCHQSLRLCCLIECWWLLAFPLEKSTAAVCFKGARLLCAEQGIATLWCWCCFLQGIKSSKRWIHWYHKLVLEQWIPTGLTCAILHLTLVTDVSVKDEC